METEYNTELTKIHHTNYVRNSRAIVVLWAIFSVIYLVLNIVVFAQPQWFGDSGDSSVAGFFGLWRYCDQASRANDFVCRGDFLEWDSILNDAFKATSILVGVSCLLFIICIGCFLLFCLLNTATVLKVCSWFQLLSGILMAVSVIVYPAGWDHPDIVIVCQSDSYDIGLCEMRWAYILAIVLVFDAFILCILGFVLAVKQANMLPEIYKDEKGRKRRAQPLRDEGHVGPYHDFYTSAFKLTPGPRSARSGHSFITD